LQLISHSLGRTHAHHNETRFPEGKGHWTVDDSLVSYASWQRAPWSIRLAAIFLVAGGVINCIHDFTPVMRASHLVPPSELRGAARLGLALFWGVLAASLQRWAWFLVLAFCLVPVPITLYLLRQQSTGATPELLGHLTPVSTLSLVTVGLNLAAAALLLLPRSRAALG
jgi:hypothetical protein